MATVLFSKEEQNLAFTFNKYYLNAENNDIKYEKYMTYDDETFETKILPEFEYTSLREFPPIANVKLFADSNSYIGSKFNQLLPSFVNCSHHFNSTRYPNQDQQSLYQKNYLESIIRFFNIFNLLESIWDTNFDNKVFALGTGDFYKQAFPNFVINNINNLNKKYEIILIETCGDKGFGCPNKYDEFHSFLSTLIPNKLSNIKITLISCEMSELPLYFSLKEKIASISKCYIINTIGTGHKITDELLNMNTLKNILKTYETAFYNNYILTNKIIYYFATGTKIIYLNTREEKFVGSQIKTPNNCKHKNQDKICELDLFNDQDISENNYENITQRIAYLDSVNSDAKNDAKRKYLKYKSKYLMLKKSLNPNN